MLTVSHSKKALLFLLLVLAANQPTVSQKVTFAYWIGVSIALAYGATVSDRLPLALVKRKDGIWKPEYRLHALWIPCFISLPVGLALFGAGLERHLPWPVPALGAILVTFGGLASLPVVMNYICECFRQYPAEATTVLVTTRTAFGLSITFFIDRWVKAVGVGWVYGTMALLTVATFGFIVLLMWKGHLIRSWTPTNLDETEEGSKVLEAILDHS